MKRLLILLSIVGICSQLCAMKRSGAVRNLASILDKFHQQNATIQTANNASEEPSLILDSKFRWPKNRPLCDGFLYRAYRKEEPTVYLEKKEWPKDQDLYKTVY